MAVTKNQIHSALADLLARDTRATLPGLGQFYLQTLPAQTDRVAGQVSPPAKRVHFNSNLVLDDGRLADRLAELVNISPQEARSQLALYVNDVRTATERGDMVDLDGLGRLHRDSRNHLKLLAADTNFDRQAFGLPTVDADIIIRSERRPTEAPLVAKTTTPAPQKNTTPAKTVTPVRTSPAPPPAAGQPIGKAVKTSPAEAWLTRNIWYLAGGLLLILLLIGIACISGKGGIDQDPIAEAEAGERTEVPQDRLNVPPSTDPAPERNDFAAETPAPETAPAPAPETTPAPPPSAVKQHTAVIAVGMFGNEANVNKLTKKLKDRGFDPVTQAENNLTRVGVRVRYTQPAELDVTLAEVKRKIEKTAFVLTIDGTKQ